MKMTLWFRQLEMFYWLARNRISGNCLKIPGKLSSNFRLFGLKGNFIIKGYNGNRNLISFVGVLRWIWCMCSQKKLPSSSTQFSKAATTYVFCDSRGYRFQNLASYFKFQISVKADKYVFHSCEIMIKLQLKLVLFSSKR